jgi:hypothetical protein
MTTPFSPIMQAAKASLRHDLSDALQLLKLAGNSASDSERLEYLVATAMSIVTSTCAATAKQIFDTIHAETSKFSEHIDV